MKSLIQLKNNQFKSNFKKHKANQMKKIFLSLFLFLGILIVPSNALAMDKFETKAWHVDMVVNENHSYTITETIDITPTGSTMHGIFRTLPIDGTFYREINGEPVNTPYRAIISDIKVPNHLSDIQHNSSDTSIRIGDPDNYVLLPQTYVIQYTFDPGEDGISEFDDVYHTLLPFSNAYNSGWETSVDNFSFTITLPKAFDASQLNFYSGAYGAINATNLDYVVEGNTISGKSTTALEKGEGITINLKLPQGYFQNTRNPKVYDWIVDGLCILITLYSLIVYFTKGRSSKIIAPIRFYPPENFNPAQVSALETGECSPKMAIAQLLYLANKGYLTITTVDTPPNPDGTGTTKKPALLLTKRKDLPSHTGTGEKPVFNACFKNSNQIFTNSNKFRDEFPKGASTMSNNILRSFEGETKRLFHPNDTKLNRYFYIAFYIFILISSITLIIKDFGFIDFSIDSFINLTVIIVFVFLLPYIVSYAFLRNLYTLQNVWSWIWRILVVILILGLICDTNYIFLIPTIIICCICRSQAKLRTEKGLQWLSEVRGFKKFIKTAKLDQLNLLVDKNPNYFFDILPYAYALKLTNKWIKNFEYLVIPNHPNIQGYRNVHHLYKSCNSTAHYTTSISTSGSGGSSGSYGGGGGFGGGGGGGW